MVYKPLGVVGLISPWNYPLLLPIGDALPALLAGNAVVIKPSELTPLSAELGREILLASGLHPDLFQLIHGEGSELGPELIRHADYIGFTGSTATGRKVAVAAAERLIPYSLELGGKNPMIVLADAPLDDAVSGFISGAFANSGQTCIAVERVFVERPLYEPLRRVPGGAGRGHGRGLVARLRQGPGSMITAEHADKVFSHVEDAVAKGGDGAGRRPPAARPRPGLRRPDAADRDEPGHDRRLRRDLRPGGLGRAGGERRGGDRAGQRHALRAQRLGLGTATATGRGRSPGGSTPAPPASTRRC